MGKGRKQEKRAFRGLTVWRSGKCKGMFPPALALLVFGGPCPPHLTLNPGSETFQKTRPIPRALVQGSGKP